MSNNYWEEPGDHVENPKPILGRSDHSNSISSRYLFNGSYLRLKTLQFGYHILPSFLTDMGISQATIYFTGQNLFTYRFGEDLQFDPEVGTDGYTQLIAKPLKTVVLGIDIKF